MQSYDLKGPTVHIPFKDSLVGMTVKVTLKTATLYYIKCILHVVCLLIVPLTVSTDGVLLKPNNI